MEEMAFAFDDIRLLVILACVANVIWTRWDLTRRLVPSEGQATATKSLPAPVAIEDRRQFHYLVF